MSLNITALVSITLEMSWKCQHWAPRFCLSECVIPRAEQKPLFNS